MSKIFFFDIDGTLYNQKEFIPSALQGIKELKEKGYHVFIATGRPEVLVYPYLKIVNPDGFIGLNGGAAYLGDKKLYELFFTNETLSDLVNDVKLNNDAYTMLSPKEFVTNDLNNDVLVNYINSFKIVGLQEKSLDFYKENDIKAFVIHAKDFEFYFNKYKNLNFYKINDYGYEVTENTYSKGTGCINVAKLLNVDIKDTYCFGDETNDISMFKTCGVSVAMGNACDELKSVATHITKDINDDGIYHALKNILKVI